MLPLCEELSIGFVCWSPLGSGFLTGTIQADRRFAAGLAGHFRPAVPRSTPAALAANLALVDVVRTWGQRKNATPAQLALAWLRAQKPYIVAVQGAANVADMQENLGAAAITFKVGEIQQLNVPVAVIHIRGDRLPATAMQMSGVEAPPKR